MAFNPAQLLALSTLVDAMQALSVEERATWLASLTPEQAAFRPVLARLLTQEAKMETVDFLSTLPKLGEWVQPNASDLATGMELGPYRLIREVGSGGMGTVWLAERSDGVLKRSVALKLPHSALPQRQLAERFGRATSWPHSPIQTLPGFTTLASLTRVNLTWRWSSWKASRCWRRAIAAS
jgi:hypothetical protein